MKKYKQMFVHYIKEHEKEIRYCGEKFDEYSTWYVFKMPSPIKFFGFIINYRFTIFNKPDDEIIKSQYIIDVDTIFNTGIRLNYEEDKELIDFLSEKFKQIYKQYKKDEFKKRLKRLLF